jgi:hypothetical protein
MTPQQMKPTPPAVPARANGVYAGGEMTSLVRQSNTYYFVDKQYVLVIIYL